MNTKKYAIITAMKEEADSIINRYHLSLSKKLHHIQVYENDSMVLLLSGIWKVQASIAASFVFENYDFNTLINIGIAGNLKGEQAKIWDVFILGKVQQHDIYLPFWWSHLDYAKGIIQLHSITLFQKKYNFWCFYDAFCITGDQFIDNLDIVKILWETYKADIVEMEAFAIASVAREYRSLEKCLFIKAISDGADNNARETHMTHLEYAMKNSLEVLEEIIWNK